MLPFVVVVPMLDQVTVLYPILLLVEHIHNQEYSILVNLVVVEDDDDDVMVYFDDVEVLPDNTQPLSFIYY